MYKIEPLFHAECLDLVTTGMVVTALQLNSSPGHASTCRPLHALCAAHAAAVWACEAHYPLADHRSNVIAEVLLSVALMVAAGPSAVGLDQALHGLFSRLWSAMGQKVCS